jgi:hypothetical protein
MTRVYNGFPLDAFPPQASSDLADVVTTRKDPTNKKRSKNSKRSRDGSDLKVNDASSASSTTTTTTTSSQQLALALAPEDVELKDQLSDKGFYYVTFEEWKDQPEGAHTCYTTPRDYLTPLNGERKRVYAVLGRHIENGRVCTGYKSEREPWNRVNYPTVRFYLKHPTSKRQQV